MKKERKEKFVVLKNFIDNPKEWPISNKTRTKKYSFSSCLWICINLIACVPASMYCIQLFSSQVKYHGGTFIPCNHSYLTSDRFWGISLFQKGMQTRSIWYMKVWEPSLPFYNYAWQIKSYSKKFSCFKKYAAAFCCSILASIKCKRYQVFSRLFSLLAAVSLVHCGQQARLHEACKKGNAWRPIDLKCGFLSAGRGSGEGKKKVIRLRLFFWKKGYSSIQKCVKMQNLLFIPISFKSQNGYVEMAYNNTSIYAKWYTRWMDGFERVKDEFTNWNFHFFLYILIYCHFTISHTTNLITFSCK